MTDRGPENTWRHMQSGKTSTEAAILAMDEIGFAVVATSLSIAAVFIPVAFMEGLVGQFFYEFGMTVTFAVVVSTVIALALSPMLCARFLKLANEQSRFYQFSEGIFKSIESFYAGMLGFALRRRWLVVVSSYRYLHCQHDAPPFIGQEFTPVADEGQFQIQAEAPVGSSI
ncbi:MAG: efflux RND transporter permease subunit [Pirellulaceae bacterium]